MLAAQKANAQRPCLISASRLPTFQSVSASELNRYCFIFSVLVKTSQILPAFALINIDLSVVKFFFHFERFLFVIKFC